MNVLITGGLGGIGSNLTDIFMNNGDKVLCINKPSQLIKNVQRHLKNPNFTYFSADITDKSKLNEISDITLPEFDTLFHLAAVVGVPLYVANPLDVLNVNIEGTKNVIELARKLDIPKLIFSSTSEVYSKNEGLLTEYTSDLILGQPHVKRWSYALSKIVGEYYVRNMCSDYGIDFTILRLFNAYGRRVFHAVIYTMFYNAMMNKEIIVHGTGEQIRTFCYVSDTAKMIYLANLKNEARNEVINIGDDRPRTINFIAEEIAELVGRYVKIKHRPYEDVFMDNSFEDVSIRVPNIVKQKKILNYIPTIHIREGLKFTFDWLRGELFNV